MATEIVRMAPQHLDAVKRFAAQVWRRPRSEAFYRWRYLEPAFHVAVLALRDGECLAMESAFRRPYRIGDEQVDVLEVFDWYTLPKLRGSGLGVRVMRGLMDEPHPLMLVGGSEDTQKLLPRLGFTRVAQASRFVLAIGAGRTARALRERGLPAPAARAAAAVLVRRPGQRPRPRAVPRDGRVLFAASVGPEVRALYEGALGYGTVPLWTPEQLAWLTAGFPGAGHFVPLYFARGDALAGWALVRVYTGPAGRDAEIVEIFAPHPDAELYTWMVSAAARCAAAFAPGRIAHTTSCPAVRSALRRNNFVRTIELPVQFSLGDREGLPAPLAIASNTGDAPLVPFVEEWWDAPRAAGR